MARTGQAAARQSNAQLAGVASPVDDNQCELPSACADWRVIDVLAHLGALAHEAVCPPKPDPTLPNNREPYHDLRVDQRRGWSHAAVIDEWRRYAPQQLDLLEAGQEPPPSMQPVTLPGLGIYPRHQLLAHTTAFNLFCHLRFDMLAPDGPRVACPRPHNTWRDHRHRASRRWAQSETVRRAGEAMAQPGSTARQSISSPGAQPESRGATTARSLATHPRRHRSWTASTSSDDWTPPRPTSAYDTPRRKGPFHDAELRCPA